MATLNFKILPARRKSSGKLGVYLAVTHKKEVRYISTEFEIDDEAEFESGKVCYRKDANIMNKRMQYVLSEYQEKLASLDLRKFQNCSQLKQALTSTQENDKQPLTITELFDTRIKQLYSEKRTKYAEMNEYSRNVITSILHDTPVNYITRNDIKILERAMVKRGYSNCNIQMRMAHFKAAINDAIDNGTLKLDDHPFRGYTMPASQVRLTDITQQEFSEILSLHSTSTRTQIGRDIWLLSFYLGGINLADLVQANLSGNTLSYQRTKTKNKKTGNKDTVITIPEEARGIIKKYINAEGRLTLPYTGPYRNLCIYLNKCLKLVASETCINSERFSFYSARKTFAQFAFELGIRTEVIEYCIGQSMKSNRPVYNYVRVMQKYADEAIRTVIDYAHSGRIEKRMEVV